jgi:hypothetical protein
MDGGEFFLENSEMCLSWVPRLNGTGADTTAYCVKHFLPRTWESQGSSGYTCKLGTLPQLLKVDGMAGPSHPARLIKKRTTTARELGAAQFRKLSLACCAQQHVRALLCMCSFMFVQKKRGVFVAYRPAPRPPI